ncbi:EF-hand domain-containing protein [Pseudoalteromonas ostreae]|uniref:EF-hand domain-containing protein n=1 Tax=Pseudoalteromonas ostreae TaxID=2774154 RepID=UPI001B384C26|nr:EF-hand domain-containing protein [Pseudoalteromonas ostreae]
MKHINTALAIFALAASSTAFAAVNFDTFDTNGDGVISQQEASVNAQLVEIFADLDTDQNGELSKEEFARVQ